jgi:hypothetical protein
MALLAVLLTGCVTPAPEPTPTATGFEDEDAAFAAAEATYRAYVDALNQVDLSNPDTFEDVYKWTTGDLNASDRKGLSRYHAEGLTVSGESKIVLLELHASDAESGAVSLDACLDVSGVGLVDAEGVSRVDPNRVDVQTLRVDLVPGDAPTALRLTNIGPRADGPEC